MRSGTMRCAAMCLAGWLVIMTASSTDAALPQPKYPGTEDGLRNLANDLPGNSELLKALKPTMADCEAIGATAEDAETMMEYCDDLYAQLPRDGLGRKDEQTGLIIHSSTTDNLQAGIDKSLPGGYTQTAKHYRKGLRFYAIKYVVPGEEVGMRYDVFVFVNGRWVLMPKVWRAFKD